MKTNELYKILGPIHAEHQVVILMPSGEELTISGTNHDHMKGVLQLHAVTSGLPPIPALMTLSEGVDRCKRELDLSNPSNAIPAIKRLRELTGQGLRECKDAIDIARGAIRKPSYFGAATEADLNIIQEEFDLSDRTKLISAIKRLREITGLGLKEAKDEIDRLANDPKILRNSAYRILAEDRLGSLGEAVTVLVRLGISPEEAIELAQAMKKELADNQ